MHAAHCVVDQTLISDCKPCTMLPRKSISSASAWERNIGIGVSSRRRCVERDATSMLRVVEWFKEIIHEDDA
jgi:hypothetical protein